MDTVSETALAIALAREGGMTIIHKNQPIDRQAEMVRKVKRSEAGMIVDPITLPLTATYGDAEAFMKEYRISGVPIVHPDGRWPASSPTAIPASRPISPSRSLRS